MLTLIVPGLIWTRQALADLTYDLPLPAFTTLLGRGRLSRRPPRDTAATLAEASGLATPLPAGALRWFALREHPGDFNWLCLDPVRLRLQERAIKGRGRISFWPMGRFYKVGTAMVKQRVFNAR